ncbi:MAG: LysM peptidoglycan-binding domain-containing protein [Tannerellaceae bacterium]|nr:LysM peptidoglycan-binding domain-containing protein [Tannerellaceae bacterium]
MTRYFLFIITLCLSFPFYAQDNISEKELYEISKRDSFPDEIGLIPESLDADVDSLLHTWHAQYFTKSENHCHDDDANVYFSEEVIRDRLNRLPHIIPMSYNNLVRKSIDFYMNKRRNLIRYMLGMADYYFPLIEPVLEEHGLPLEFKYLAVVESALNPVAVSRVGACGLWQFMLPTGKSYGLDINSLIDERRDPIRSTHAASSYFKDMYNLFNGDWNLVIASYNCGPGNVSKAIRRAGGETDFWKIYPYLPRETRSYVPLFIAACYVMNYYCEHNLCPMQTALPLATDTVMLAKAVSFQTIAGLIDIDVDLLRTLNPQYRRDIVPGNIKPLPLKLPASYAYAFIDKTDDIYNSSIDELLLATAPKQQQIIHTVQKGENIVTIADKYGITARDIRRLNGLSSNKVAAGKQLRLKVNNGGIAFASTKTTTAAPSSASTTKQQTSIAASSKTQGAPITTPKLPTTNETMGGTAITTYIVKSGDSLYSISRNAGTTVAILQKANNLTGTNIRPGQKLIIPKG